MEKKNLEKIETALGIMVSLGFAIMMVAFWLITGDTKDIATRNLEIANAIGAIILVAAILALFRVYTLLDEYFIVD